MLLAVVVGVLFFDPTEVGKYVLASLALLAVCSELARLIGSSFGILLVMSCVWALVGLRNLNDPPQPFGVVFLVLGAFGSLLTNASKQKTFPTFCGGWFLGGSAIGLLGLLEKSMFPPILTAAIPIWAGDTAAIFAGKAFGKHKLAPSISPNKTWEGSVANLLAAVGAAAALGYFLKYPMDKMLLLGVSCGVIGQLGDLFESYLKRQAGVKDSGNLLPGHGGVFDRLDSLLMTAPFSYWILSSFLK